MTALLDAERLCAGYHGIPVVRDLDLKVEPGEVVALLGPNGAGKTTTIMTLAGHLAPTSGTIRFHGREERRPLYQRARDGMSLVTERRSVFSRLTTSENLRVGRCPLDQALALFPELEPLLGRLGGQLSGGEQQMLTLARALGRGPDVLLADELSLGLAPLIVTRLLEAIRRAATEHGVGILLVEQHIHQALRYADRVYAMNRGRIVLSGTADEVAPRLEDAYLSAESAPELPKENQPA